MDGDGEEEGWMQKMEWKNHHNPQSYNDVLNQVKELQPTTLEEWQEVSDMYWKLGKFQSCWDAQWQHWLLLQQQKSSLSLLQQAQCMNRLGCIAMQLNEYEESKLWLDQSLKYKQTHYKNQQQTNKTQTMDSTIGQTELGKSYNSLALWYLQQDEEGEEHGYHECALDYLNQAEQEYRFALPSSSEQQQTMEEYCNICQNLATLYRQHGDYGKALEFYQLAFHNIPPSKSKKILEVRLHLADIYYALEQYHEAAEHYEIVLKQINDNNNEDEDDGSKSIVHMNLGRVHAQSGRHELAMNHYQHALDTVVETVQEAPIYNAMGALYAVQDDEITALRYFNMALDIYREFNHKINSYEDEIQYTQSNIERVQQSLFTSSNNSK